MLVSITHRVTGVGLALGAALLVWWLTAAASGPEAYADFVAWATWPWMLIVWVGVTWALFQHGLSGMRHFVLDAGAGYELDTNKKWALATMIGAIALTAALWAWIILGRGA